MTQKPLIDPQLGSYQSHHQQVNGKKIHFVTLGQGPALLFVHGWNNNWHGWWPVAKLLKDRFTLYLVDLPGFGHSDQLPRYDMETQAQYLAGLIKTLPQQPEAVVGLSMGSLVTAQLCHDYPHLVKRAILFGSVLRSGRRRRLAHLLMKGLMKTANTHSYSRKALKRLVDTYLYSYLTAKYINMYRFNPKLLSATGIKGKKLVKPEAFVQMGLAETGYSIDSILSGCHVPLLLVFGSHDKVTSRQTAEAILKQHTGNFHFATISRAGHVAPMEQPRIAAKLIAGFVASIGPTSADSGQNRPKSVKNYKSKKNGNKAITSKQIS